MNTEFENKLDCLLRSVTTSPEDEEWFFPAVKELIEKFGPDKVREFVQTKPTSIYITTLLIKAGLKGVDESLLLEHLNKIDEDEVYDAALSLAIYGHSLGFEILYEFANESHKLSKHIIPKLDILPDLKFIHHPKAKELKVYIENKYSDINIK
ncbi:MAG: hypothetical protein COA67_05765 [Lutibacter sp.]|nr:MAG: hypothetical protein COA67_05765 [Lutibacter sp.]